ncbi:MULTISPECIES: RidA family protein [unclassified Streptomyces]|uniref:RidA family protein n=1 Tax=unclassified Streptomyces TaxID=2593676 RepID=UPI003829A4F8
MSTPPRPAAAPVKRAVHSDRTPPPAGGYSKAIAAGPYLFTSGLGPQDPVTGAVAGTVREQTRQVLANLRALLRADGLDLDDVVKSTVHLQHLHRDFAAYDEVYREHFSDPRPVRTTVGSDLMDILVEIDVVALRHDPAV